MERLTMHTPDDFGYAEYQLKFGVSEKATVDRLAAYEDTELEPEDIITIKAVYVPDHEELKAYRKLGDIDRLRELAEADRDGRLVVLSEPMVPLMASDDEMDTDVYCPKCGESLSGGWQDSEADDTRKLCQCPRCGQSIDDTKVISRADAEKALDGEK